MGYLSIKPLKMAVSILGSEWNIEKYECDRFFAKHNSGLMLFVSSDTTRSIPTFTLGFFDPNNRHVFVHHTSIGCSLNKSIDKIMNDIKQKLLIHFDSALAHLNELRKAQADCAEVLDTQNKLFNELQSELSLEPLTGKTHYVNYKAWGIHTHNSDCMRGEVIVPHSQASSKEPKFDLHLNELDHNQIKAIISLINV
ncbi:hypothetical protein ACTFQF_00190 [Aliivibrio fischeri]|uniref:Uncharacterized protein n=1 Tax=Aliivibrio fischeri (strain MJ11) TaxID=388396 RepID=B5EW25_ALIFM|nr:hypothetical protein [Aliivibrio fischeri]ACH64729.1 hypothetical protein VFMJ11_B0082 [Aliivibrio fischeri MJ11]MUK37475.1 hypothetical protein [Aliivibrio fischeri]